MAERIDHKDFRSYEYGRGRNRKYTMRYFSRPESSILALSLGAGVQVLSLCNAAMLSLLFCRGLFPLVVDLYLVPPQN